MSWRGILEEQTAAIAATDSGNTLVVAAPGENRRIVLESYLVVTDTDIVIKFQSATTDKTGSMKPGANGVLSANSPVVFGTNEAFNINLGGSAVVGGHCSYRVEELIS